MIFKDFFFSYKNILINNLQKKKFFSFFKKTFNIIYKYILSLVRIYVFKTHINLDELKQNKKYYKFKINSLFKKFNCDKGSQFVINNKKIKSHNYSIFYEKYLKRFKHKKINVLELGSHEGKGIASFYYFFPKANLYAANINPFQLRYTSKRVREIYVDVSSKKILKNLSKHLNIYFDVIIDDASHNLRDILLTLPIFFKKLRKNGFYIIEDINQFKVFDNLNPTKEKLTPLLILKLMKKNLEFKSNFISKKNVDYLKKNISNYYFESGEMIYKQHNISDIVFLKKK